MGVTLLLDTHALLSPNDLGPRAVALLRDPENVLLVSAASAWEIATKHRLGKLAHAGAVVTNYVDHVRTLGATEAPITSAQALLAGRFDVDHRDPFDRMIAAQAVLLGVPVVTRDSAFGAFPCETIW